MKNRKYIMLLCLSLMSMIILFNGKVFAGNVSVENVDTSGSYPNNRYLATGAGEDTDHSQVVYKVDNERAYCIQAGIAIRSSYTYSNKGKMTNKSGQPVDLASISWAAYNIADEQVRQAVIWELAGYLGYGSYVIDSTKDDDFRNALNAALNATTSQPQPSNAKASYDGNKFKYDRGTNCYISPYVTISDAQYAEIRNDNGMAHFIDDNGRDLGRQVGNGKYRLAVPAAVVANDMSGFSVFAKGGDPVQVYDVPDVYGDGNSAHQLVVKPAMTTRYGSDGESGSLTLTAVGDMKVVKKDEHGVPVQGAKFRVTGGPDNINEVIVTLADGTAQLLEQRIGDYNIVEVEVPPTLVLNTRSFTINVKSGTMVSYDVYNDYERGELGLKKEDVLKELNKVNYGDGNFEGIVVGLYAAEDIFEGPTKVLSKDDPIAKRTLNAKGEEVTVKEFTRQDGKYFDGLPLGKYYWKEDSSNVSYLMPAQATVEKAKKEKYEQTITYLNQNVEFVPKQTTTMYDQERYGRVIVYKSDADNNNLSGKNNTDENPAVGAVLRLTLKSNYNATAKAPIDPNRDTYTAEVDKYGRAEFVDPDFESKFGGTGIDLKNTIPFGDYVLDEIKTSNNGKSYYYGIQDTEVGVIENNKAYNVIVKDEPIPVFIEMVKRDADNDDLNGGIHEIVTLKGAGFKIWDCQAGDWLVQELPKTKEKIDTFITNNEGHCITPQKVNAGKFIIYEVDTPEGYYLNEEYRLPMDEKGNVIKSQLGDEKYGGKLVDIRNISVYVSDAEEYPEGEGILDYEYINDHLKVTVTFEDNTTRGNIDVFKMGEVFADFTSSTSKKYEGDGYTDSVTEYTPKYEMQALANCKFEVWAVEDATTIDGRVKEKANSKKHIITTDSTGHGICRNEDGTEDMLFCNPKYGTKYHIHEIESPAGYDLAEDQEVVVFPGTKYKQVEMKGLEVHDKYIPFNLKLDKKFVRTNDEDIMFKPANEINRDPAVAIFGLYSEQDLVATNGKEIPKDTLIQSIRVVEGKGYIESYKLPDGNYYLEELYTSEPYTILDKDTREPHRYDFTVVHKKDVKTEQDVVVTAENTYPTGDLYVVKISSTNAIQAGGLTLKSNDIGYEEVREFTETYSDKLTLQYAEGKINVQEALADAVETFNLDRTDYEILAPAEYGVYVDPECKIPLQQSDDGGEHYTDVVLKPMQVTENGRTYYNGVYSVKGIQEGTYYVKEIVPPTYVDRKGKVRKYKLSNDITVVEISNSNVTYEEQMVVIRVLTDEAPIYEIDKTDIFTDKGIPDCLFTITDKDGNELLRFVTNEEGKANIPTDIFVDGETYYFTELDAPKFPYYDGDVLYELNTEPHKFIAHVDEDGKWTLEFEDEDGNVQEYEKVKIQNYRTTTGVELTKLDMVDSTPIPNCRFELKGIDTDFYETGVTDENGIYFFTDVPYGRYTYTELEAPEGWLIDTTPHEFTLDSHGTKIVVYDERKVDLPDTGDIAVAAIACVAVISVAGIVFLAIRKKKASSSK